ncbi:MAG TPA: hypothetical protein PLL02_00720 [Bacteroidales bacterium]|nr:hypothetical protein [Bacteroidales bacterium]
MKTKTFLIILLLIGIFWSCERQCILPKEEIGTGEIIANAKVDIVNKCFDANEIPQGKDGKCIQSDSQNIDNLQVSFDGGIHYQAIDFSKYSVLEKEVQTAGCSIVCERNVSKDTKNKKIVYTVTVHQCGGCEKLNTSWNWVLVPKIPEDYSIEYKVFKKYVKEKLRSK